jgi:hypothetical protein
MSNANKDLKGSLYLAVKVPNTLGKEWLHMTLCFIGKRTDKEVEEIYGDVTSFKGLKQFKVLFTDPDMFGPPENRTIPVIKCEMIGSEETQSKIFSFYKKWYDSKEGHGEIERPNLHVSFKNTEDRTRVSFEQRGFIASDIYLARIGDEKPLLMFPLEK